MVPIFFPSYDTSGGKQSDLSLIRVFKSDESKEPEISIGDRSLKPVEKSCGFPIQHRFREFCMEKYCHPYYYTFAEPAGSRSRIVLYSGSSSSLGYLMYSVIERYHTGEQVPFDSVIFTGDVTHRANETSKEALMSIAGITHINEKIILSIGIFLERAVYMKGKQSEIKLQELQNVYFCYKDIKNTEDSADFNIIIRDLVKEHGSLIDTLTFASRDLEFTINGSDINYPAIPSSAYTGDEYILSLTVNSKDGRTTKFTFHRVNSIDQILNKLFRGKTSGPECRKKCLSKYLIILFFILIISSAVYLMSYFNIKSAFEFLSPSDDRLYIFQDSNFNIESWSPSVVITHGGAYALGSERKPNREREILIEKSISGSSKDVLHLKWNNNIKNSDSYVTYIISGENGNPFARDEKIWRKKTFSIRDYKFLCLNIKNNSGITDKPKIALRFEDINANKTDSQLPTSFLEFDYSETENGTYKLYKINIGEFDYTKNARDWTKAVGEKNTENVDKNKIKQINIDCYNTGNIYISEIFLQK